MTRLILASTSPRRAELLRQIGVRFEQCAVEVDESPRPGEVAAELVLRLARAKAEAGMRDVCSEDSAPPASDHALPSHPLPQPLVPPLRPFRHPCRKPLRGAAIESPHQGGGGTSPSEWAVLAADTLVSLDGEPLGKPRDREDFLAMLRRLSGRRHEVYTAVALAWGDGLKAFLSVSHVDFRPLIEKELLAYWATGEPCDKAGGYAIQGRAAVFITRLEGSFSGVMGLPLFETAELLRQAGIPFWSKAQ